MAFREAIIQAMLCDFVRMQYPNAYFVSDSAGEHRATVGQRQRAARLRKSRGYPDFFMAEPRGIFHGLFLELKAENKRLEKAKGGWINEHTAEQYKCLSDLWIRGYCAQFAIGLDDAITKVQDYMRLEAGADLPAKHEETKQPERVF